MALRLYACSISGSWNKEDDYVTHAFIYQKLIDIKSENDNHNFKL